MSTPGYVYAAYNSAPADLAEHADEERRWYDLLGAEELIGGLELGFNGGLHPVGVAALAPLLKPGWRCVVNDIPGTIANTRRDARYGLASTDDEARRRAVDDVRELARQVRELADLLGPGVVRAVELHSAPMTTPGNSSADLFVDSLDEIASWEWGDVLLVIEHADAVVAGRTPEKGYLALADETRSVLLAAERSGRRIGQSINWGRSAIESGSAAGALEHVRSLRAAGMLDGLMLSGASGLATARSAPWQDVHLAIDEVEPESILTRVEIAATLRAVDAAALDFVGVKVGRPAGAESLQDRLSGGLATLAALDAVARSLPQPS